MYAERREGRPEAAGFRRQRLIRGAALIRGHSAAGYRCLDGTLAASLLDMDFKSSVIAVMGGVLLAGIIMWFASAGAFEALWGNFRIKSPQTGSFPENTTFFMEKSEKRMIDKREVTSYTKENSIRQKKAFEEERHFGFSSFYLKVLFEILHG